MTLFWYKNDTFSLHWGISVALKSNLVASEVSLGHAESIQKADFFALYFSVGRSLVGSIKC